MLPGSTLPLSLVTLLKALRPCFTAPTFETFAMLVTGFLSQTGEVNVCGMLSGAGLAQRWHHSRAHRFFSNAQWSVDEVGLRIASLIVERLVPRDGPLHLVVDDTLFTRVGRKVFGAQWCHDGSAKGPKKVAFGNCFVAVGLVVRVPFCNRPVCMPVLFGLWHKGVSKVATARRLVCMLADEFPVRTVHVTADAAYASRDLRMLPKRITWTTRLRKDAALYDLAPPRTGKRGRPALKGKRLGSLAQLSERLAWMQREVTRYGVSETIEIAHRRVLWYTPFGPQVCRVVLVREIGHGGYDIALITTDIDARPEHIIERYSQRWSIEVAFEEAKQVMGVGDARNRTENAVRRTVPFGLLCQSLLWLWYPASLHNDSVVADRREREPWYRTKTAPSTSDMLTAARRTIIAARFSQGRARDLTFRQIEEMLSELELMAS